MLPILVISMAMAFFIMVRMGVFDTSEVTKVRGRPSPSSWTKQLLDAPPSVKGQKERLEIFEDFIEKLRGPDEDDNQSGR